MNRFTIFLELFKNMKQVIFYPLLFLILHFNHVDNGNYRSIHTIKKLEDTSNFAIIKFDKFYHGSAFDKSCKSTTLSSFEVKKLQNLLDSIVSWHNNFLRMDSGLDYNSITLDLSNYKRQFIPVLNVKGEKEVLVNCICLESIANLKRVKINWRKDLFKVNDGGKCHFHLIINLTTKEYRNFIVNGN